MPKKTSTFNGSIKYPKHQSSVTMVSRWDDTPLEVGLEIEVVSGQRAGQTGVIVKLEREKNQTPKIWLRLQDGYETDSAALQWKRRNHQPPIWSGPEHPLGITSSPE